MAHSSNEYQRRYMAEYRRRQAIKNAQKDDSIAEGENWKSLALDAEEEQGFREVIDDWIKEGRTPEQAIDSLIQSITPADMQREEQLEDLKSEFHPVETASDSVSPCSHQAESQKVPEVKKDCWATEKSIKCQGSCNPECYHAYFTEAHKPQAQKDAERYAKINALLEVSKERQRKDEIDGLIRIGAIFREAEKKREQQVDTIAQKYMDRGIDERTARHDAEVELRQIEGAERMQRMKQEHEWMLKTPEERSQIVDHLLEDNKRLMRGEKPRYQDDHHTASDSDEFGKSVQNFSTVGNLFECGQKPHAFTVTLGDGRKKKEEEETEEK